MGLACVESTSSVAGVGTVLRFEGGEGMSRCGIGGVGVCSAARGFSPIAGVGTEVEFEEGVGMSMWDIDRVGSCVTGASEAAGSGTCVDSTGASSPTLVAVSPSPTCDWISSAAT